MFTGLLEELGVHKQHHISPAAILGLLPIRAQNSALHLALLLLPLLRHRAFGDVYGNARRHPVILLKIEEWQDTVWTGESGRRGSVGLSCSYWVQVLAEPPLLSSAMRSDVFETVLSRLQSYVTSPAEGRYGGNGSQLFVSTAPTPGPVVLLSLPAHMHMHSTVVTMIIRHDASLCVASPPGVRTVSCRKAEPRVVESPYLKLPPLSFGTHREPQPP
jgi:hypothetical protein